MGIAQLPQLLSVFQKKMEDFSLKPSDFEPQLSENPM